MLEGFTIALAAVSLVMTLFGMWVTFHQNHETDKLVVRLESALSHLRSSVELVVAKSLEVALSKRDEVSRDLRRLSERVESAGKLLESVRSGLHDSPDVQLAVEKAERLLGEAKSQINLTGQRIVESGGAHTVYDVLKEELLDALRRRGESTVDELAVRMHSDKAVVETCLEELESAGLVAELDGSWKVS